MQADHILDATGLLCPLPVLRAAKRMRSLSPGEILEIRADDPAAVIDIPHFCTEQSYELLASDEKAGLQIYLIRKPG